MHKKNEKLFLLISKLSASEKGYINKSLKHSNPKSNLLNLYNILCKMKEYDESKLKKKIKNSSISKNLSETKKQLFKSILRIMRTFHADKNIYNQLLSMLDDISFLYDKGMLGECESLIKKCMEISEKYELYGMTIHIIDWRKKIHLANYKEKKIEDNINQLQKLGEVTLQKLEEVHEIEFSQINIVNMLFHDKNKTSISLKSYIHKIENQILENSNYQFLNVSNRIKSAILVTLCRIYFDFYKDSKKATHLLNQEQYNLDFSSISPNIADNIQRFLIQKMGIAIFLFGKSDADWFEISEKQLEILHGQYPSLKNHEQTNLKLTTYKVQKNHLTLQPHNKVLISSLEKILLQEKEQNIISSWSIANLMIYHFIYGMYEEAHYWGLKLLSLPKAINFHYIFPTKILLSIILISLKRNNLIDVHLTDLRRYAKRNGHMNDDFNEIILFLRICERLSTKKQFSLLLKKYNELEEKYPETIKWTFDFTNLKLWISATEKKMSIYEYKKIENQL